MKASEALKISQEKQQLIDQAYQTIEWAAKRGETSVNVSGDLTQDHLSKLKADGYKMTGMGDKLSGDRWGYYTASWS